MIIKRLFDVLISFLALLFLSPVILLLVLISSILTDSSGLFLQKRIGQFGKIFTILKIKTVHPITEEISAFSNFLRRTKLDELPQLFNILKGEMSFVGPRPDIPGYYDKLEGDQRLILQLKPGLTSEASLKYANEDAILNKLARPLEYNDNVIFPDKVRMNLDYYNKRHFLLDLKIICKTIFFR